MDINNLFLSIVNLYMYIVQPDKINMAVLFPAPCRKLLVQCTLLYNRTLENYFLQDMRHTHGHVHPVVYRPEGGVVAEVLAVLFVGDSLVHGVNSLQDLASLLAVQAQSTDKLID